MFGGVVEGIQFLLFWIYSNICTSSLNCEDGVDFTEREGR